MPEWGGLLLQGAPNAGIVEGEGCGGLRGRGERLSWWEVLHQGQQWRHGTGQSWQVRVWLELRRRQVHAQGQARRVPLQEPAEGKQTLGGRQQGDPYRARR